MGIEKELKVAHVFEQAQPRDPPLAAVEPLRVACSTPSSSPTGNLVYVNAGHQPPILFFRDEQVIELSNGGTVIGPLPEARFRRGFARLHPGEVLLMLHRRDPRAPRQGRRVLRRRARARRGAPAPVAAGGDDPGQALRRGARLGRRPPLGGRRHDRGAEGSGARASASSSATRASMLATEVRPSRRKRRGRAPPASGLRASRISLVGKAPSSKRSTSASPK